MQQGGLFVQMQPILCPSLMYETAACCLVSALGLCLAAYTSTVMKVTVTDE